MGKNKKKNGELCFAKLSNYTNTKVGVAYSTSSIATTLGITYGVVYTSK